jgi:pimeloyl-ACP methyl ester carboxylesterase
MEKSGELSANGQEKAIAWKQHPGISPGVVFLGGFRSDMEGGKVGYLADRLAAVGRSFTRFDYRGHGQSRGHYADYTVTDWLQDALAVVDQLTKGPLVLVGSSLGGWLALRVAELRPERVKGLVLIAPAPDFPVLRVLNCLTEAQRRIYEAEGVVVDANSGFSEPTRFTRSFIESSHTESVFTRPYRFDGPVRVLQGMKDMAVPWQQSAELVEHIKAPDVRLILFKEGDHRLSAPAQLEVLGQMVDDVVNRVTV